MKATFKEFTISTFDHIGEKASEWSSNYHIVTVKSSATGKKTSFDFFCSVAHPTFEGEYDVLNAFYCFASDAESGLYSFEDFCAEFGYDLYTHDGWIKARKIWLACKRAYKKFIRMSGYNESEFYDFLNELAETAA